jgi:EmrB/QacA subfamily drug resistance transporter
MNDRSVYPLGMKRTFAVFAGLMLGMLLASLNQTIVATALPKITADLGGLSQYSWVFSAYMLGATVTVPLYGKLSDVYGRRPFFMLGILLFSAGSLISGFAPSMEVLIAGRAVQGLGAGGLIPLAMAVIGDIVPPRRRGKWQALTGVVFGTASVIGPATGGFIADNASWRWAFFVSLPLGLLALVVVWFTFGKQERHERHSIDYRGAMLLTAGATTGLLAAVWGGREFPWSSPEVIGLFLVAAALLIAFVVWEHRAAEPILPPRLFANRTFAASQLALFMMGGAMFGAIYFVPLFVQAALGESATHSGAVLTPLMLGLIAASVTAGQIVSRTGRYRGVLFAGPPIMATGFFLLTRLGVESSSSRVTGAVVIVGIGIGLVMQTFTVVVQNTVRRREIGVATASAQFFRSIGATIAVTAMGAIVTSGIGTDVTDHVDPKALAAAVHPVFWLGVVLGGIALAAVFFVEHVELRATMTEDPVEPASAPSAEPKRRPAPARLAEERA